ncbi:hypothetical protein BH20ACT6_BH20ACT6_13530 [soil metagenome]
MVGSGPADHQHACDKDDTMYEMYPTEWAPGHHSSESRETARALQVAIDLRDNGGERPDDS